MGDVLFYHMTRSSLEATLLQLLPRALKAGWQVELRGCENARMQALDAALWLGPEEDFLPHGLAGAQDADQPVLLTAAPANPPRACVMSVDGAEVSADEAEAAARICVLFDGGDEMAVARARDQWRALTGAGLAAQYWAQEGGSWVKKAESS